MDSGHIIEIAPDQDGKIIVIKTQSGIILDYGHVTPEPEIAVGKIVYSGQKIGSSNISGMPGWGRQHMVHVGVYSPDCRLGNITRCLDPYGNKMFTSLVRAPSHSDFSSLNIEFFELHPIPSP